MKEKLQQMVEKFIGFSAGTVLVVSLLGLIGAVLAVLSGDYVAAGLALIAAALGFGLFLLAVLSV
jgi:hypothetical protein